MKSLTSIDLYFLMKEFSILKGAKINQIYSHKNKDLALQFYSRKLGKVFLTIKECKFVYLSKQKEYGWSTNNFCLMLRNKLRNAIVKLIEQCGTERIIHLELENNERFHLYIELFAKGNIILCNEKNDIIGIAQKQKWKNREIAIKKKYKVPRSKINYKETDTKQIQKLVNSKEEEIVKTLATDLSLGGIYAEEICWRIRLAKNKKTINENEAKKIDAEINKILKTKISPNIVKKNSKILAIIPFPLRIYETAKLEKVINLNKAYSKIFAIDKREIVEDKKLKKFDELISKLHGRIQDQSEHIEKQEKIIKINQSKGDLLFEYYPDISKLLTWHKINKKQKDFDEIKEELKKNKKIKKITKKGEISIELK